METTLVTSNSYQPLTIAQAKKHLRVDHTNDDEYINACIAGALQRVEQITKRKIVTQTWKYFLHDWPDESIILPYGKLQSVTHVKYKDADGDQSTWDSGEYIVDTDSEPGRITLDYGESYPTETLYPSLPIEIQFVCGFGSYTPLTVSGATNASPIVITSSTHGLVTGDRVLVEDVVGNTAANGEWIIEKVDDNSFKLLTSSGNAAYTSGGKIIEQSSPANIIHAMKLIISDMYENRETETTQKIYKNNVVDALLKPFVLWGAP